MPYRNRAAGWLALAAALSLAGCGGPPNRPRGAGRAVSDEAVKVGRPYQAGGRIWVPADDRGYDRTGLASWYGAAHRGLPTANGERFDPDGISAAHTTLPLPSYAEVTALATGRTIVVRINDRGPFAGGRIIDLSQGAARRLGVEREGVARVRVRRVYPSERDRAALRSGHAVAARPAAARAKSVDLVAGPGRAEPIPPIPSAMPAVVLSKVPPIAPAGPPDVAQGFAPRGGAPAFLDLGGFDDPDRADAFASAAAGIGPAAVVGVGAEWRVRIGPYRDDDAARSALARAGVAGYHDAHIVRQDRPESDR